MKRKNQLRASRFHKGDLAVVTHSIYGLLENMIVTVYDGNKDNDKKIVVEAEGKLLRIDTKYLKLPKSSRFSSEFNGNDDVKVTRIYHRFLPGSISKVISNYSGSSNQIIIRDERGVTGPIPEKFLTHA